MIDARHGWNAAQRAAERERKKPRQMHGPIGCRLIGARHSFLHEACQACGFSVHAPTCPTQRPPAPPPSRLLDGEQALREMRDGKTVQLVTSISGASMADESRQWCFDAKLQKFMFRWAKDEAWELCGAYWSVVGKCLYVVVTG